MIVDRVKKVRPRCDFCGEEKDAIVLAPTTYSHYALYMVGACADCLTKALELLHERR